MNKMVAVVIGMLLGTVQLLAQNYQLQVLKTPNGWHDLSAVSINNNDRVLVNYTDGKGVARTSIYYGTGFVTTLPQGGPLWGRCVNDNKEVGGTTMQDGKLVGFLIKVGGFFYPYGGAFNAQVTRGGCIDILDRRIVTVNDANDPLLMYGQFRDNKGNTQKIVYPKAPVTAVESISNNGFICGWFAYDRDDSPVHGFLFDRAAGEYRQIDVPGAISTYCLGTNNNQDVVGEYVDAKSRIRAFLLTSGKFTLLDFDLNLDDSDYMQAFGINDNRTVVGALKSKQSMESVGWVARVK